jgi:hypothetical protein
MAKFLFVYHGGSRPESKEAAKEVMNAWGKWFGSMGSAVVDGGNPVGESSTVKSDGSVASNGGANPASGYSLIEASNLKDALAKAKGCPILSAGGSVEVAEAIDM